MPNMASKEAVKNFVTSQNMEFNLKLCLKSTNNINHAETTRK